MPNTQGGHDTWIERMIYPNATYEEKINEIEGDPATIQISKTRQITLGNQTIAHIDVNPQGAVEKILVFSDHLGSSSLLTDSMGRVKTLYDYYPFGSTRLDSSDGLHVSAYQYTGKELDEETGLNYYGARYYEAGVGRFTQVDPRIMKAVSDILSNPQALNAYSYALNNPIRYTDPTGQDAVDFFKGVGKGAWEGLKDLGKGVVEVLQNPTVLVTGIVDFFGEAYNSASNLMQMYIADPQGTKDQIKDACAYLIKGWQNLSDEEKGKIIGYALEKSAEAFFATKVAGKIKEPEYFKNDMTIDMAKVERHHKMMNEYGDYKIVESYKIRYYSKFKETKSQNSNVVSRRFVVEIDAKTEMPIRSWEEFYGSDGQVLETRPLNPQPQSNTTN